MNNRRRNLRCSRTLYLNYIPLLLASLVLTIAAINGEDQNNGVVNIEPSEVDIKTRTQTVTDTIAETQILEQTSEVPVVLQSDKQTDEQTQSPVSETLEEKPTASEIPGTPSEHESILQPSSTESSISVQETSKHVTMETAGTTHSIYTGQSEEPVSEHTLEKQTEEIADKSLYTVTEQAEPEQPQEDVKELAPEVVEEPGEKIEKDLSSEAAPEPDREGELDTAAIPKEGEIPGVDKKPGPVDVEVEDKSGEKPEEEGLTFNEWAQKVLAEEEKEKHHAKSDNVAVTSTKQRKKKNYALQECGAKILASNPEGTNVKSVLNPNKDDYMINPCKVKKWFVIELCEPMQAVNVEMASFELFSSQPKSFKLFLSDRYPTKDWKLAVQQEMSEERAVQSFDVEDAEGYFAKFVRVELLDHYSNEHFCPLTLFRLFGIAVVDYDISDSEEEYHDGQDQEEDDLATEEDGEGDSQNLFSSAKDTVLKIVKKVLNVEDKVDEEQQHLNETSDNFNQNVSLEETKILNTSAASGTLPCPPDARIPGSGESQPPVLGDPQPQPPHPGATNDATLVTKIEDHEQIETGDQPFLTDTHDRAKLLHAKIENCFSCSNHTQMSSFIHSFPVTQLCVYIKLLLDKYKGQTCSIPIHTIKTETEEKEVGKQIETSLELSTPTSPQSIHAESDTKSKESDTMSDILQTSVTPYDINGGVSLEQSVSKSAGDSAILTDQSDIKIISDMETSTVAEVMPEHTVVVPESSTVEFQTVETVIPTQTVLVQQSNIYDSSIKSATSVVVENGPESSVINIASDKIEPSPSVVTESRESNLLSSTSREATPSLQGTENQPSKMVDTVAVASSDQGFLETASVVDHVVTTEEASVESTVRIAVEPDQQVKPTPITQEQETPSVKLVQMTDDIAQPADQTLDTKEQISDVKAIEEDTKKKTLDLVKVSLVPFTKRESAIMRLNNRIKVLEQNVSLSSRFLEELSKRYKKQSEDMIKMLNKTVARLNNVTLEAEIKDKLHDDALSIMESRVENLTAIVTELTVKLDRLNQQVTDRQMIWTSIEIIMLLIIMIVLVRRGKTTTLVPEKKEKLVSVPVRPVKPSFRRNSLSGPSTPSKTKSDLDPGPTLQRFSSEKTLVHCDYPVIEPGETPFFTPQPKDGLKKKRKKKHKNLESKYPACLKGSNSEQAIEKGKNSIPLPGSSINSAGVLFRGESNEKLETSVQKSDLRTYEKHFVDSTRSQRSNSSVSCSSSGTSIGSSESCICDKNPPSIFQGAFSKKPGKLSGISQGPGTKTCGSKKAKTSPTLPRNNKTTIKTHKRQRSLPLNSNSVPLIENVGSVESTVSHDNLSSAKHNSLQKGTSKGKTGVRKSLSMTAASKHSKHEPDLNKEEGKFHDSLKLEKGTPQQRGANLNFNGIDNLPLRKNIDQYDQTMFNNVNPMFDHSLHNTNGLDTYGGLGVNGSKSCCNIDPGGAVCATQFNGYAVNGHDFMNGHSSDKAVSNGNDRGIDLRNKENSDNPSAKSGWKQMIGWF